jgi:hypothetical protein
MGVVMPRAAPSPMECVTRMYSTRNGPISIVCRGWTGTGGDLVERVLLEPLGDEAERQGGPEDRDVEFAEEVRKGADVVFVAVGEENGADAVPVLDEVREVGDREVHAEHLVFGEHEAAVDDDDRVAELVGHHVHADLAQAAEGDRGEGGADGFTHLLLRVFPWNARPIRRRRTAFWACRRFSAWSRTTDREPSRTSAVISSPRWAGRQCITTASGRAAVRRAAFTWYPANARRRWAASSSCPMLVHTSV